MSLVRNIEKIEECERLSPKTRRDAIKETIESYRPVCPLLNKVIAGETTFQGEMERLGFGFLLQKGNMELNHGNYMLEEGLKMLDKVVTALYPKIDSEKKQADYGVQSRGDSELDEINEERFDYDLPPITHDDLHRRAAEYMEEKYGYDIDK